MVQGPTWDVDAPLDNPTENAYVQCSGPLGDNNYARPKLGYTKQIGGYCQLHCEVSKTARPVIVCWLAAPRSTQHVCCVAC